MNELVTGNYALKRKHAHRLADTHTHTLASMSRMRANTYLLLTITKDLANMDVSELANFQLGKFTHRMINSTLVPSVFRPSRIMDALPRKMR